MTAVPTVSLHQPWASLIATRQPCPTCGRAEPLVPQRNVLVWVRCGTCNGRGGPFVKTIETRSWRAPAKYVGQRIAIHAAARPMRLPKFRPLTPQQSALLGVWDDVHDRLCECGHPAVQCLRYGLASVPLGAVVCTARLVECLPMVEASECDGSGPSHLCLDEEGLYHVSYETTARFGDVTDQRPYGDFAPGRWAWMLADVEPLAEPVPAVGRQGWFTVELP